MNEQQPTPEREQQPAPENGQTVAAVRDNEAPAAPPQAEPKPAPAAERQARPDSRIAVAPVPPVRQGKLIRRLSRTSAVWLITVPGAIVCLLIAAFDLCTTSQEIFKTSLCILSVMALGLLWTLITTLLFSRRPVPPALWNEVRINELFPQGAVSRGASGTIVLPFDEITLYEESADWLTLSGPGGMIQWAATDLTPPAATSIQLYLRTRVPAAALHIKSTFRASATALSPIPTLPRRGASFAAAMADTRPGTVAALRFGQALVRCTPLMWMLAMSSALLICLALAFDTPALNSPWVWFVGLAAVQAAALYGLIRWHAAANKSKPHSTPDFLFCEDGLWMSTGRGAVRFPRGSVPAVRLSNALELRLPSGSVRLPYRHMSDQDLIFRYFGIIP